MKTQQELMQAYWCTGGVVDMVRVYNTKHLCDVKPWECVRLSGQSGCTHPEFTHIPCHYTFALTILYDDKRNEHRPVWEGSELYYLEEKVRVKKSLGCHSILMECGIAVSLLTLINLSWNPPTSKRTFKIGDMELPCPGKYYNGALLGLLGIDYFFKTVEDRNKVASAITEILTAARDKE